MSSLMQRVAAAAGVVVLLGSGLVGLAAASPSITGGVVPAIPIPQNQHRLARVPAFLGRPATPHRVRGVPAIPRAPFMAPNGSSNIHDDTYMSDTYTYGGPLGLNPKVRSAIALGECATITFDRAGRIVTVCVGRSGPVLELLDPHSLARLASFILPTSSSSSGFGAGGYFYLDNHDQAVIPTHDRHIFVMAERRGPAGFSFAKVADYNLQSYVPSSDKLYSVLPDFSGRLWFITAAGRVGTIDPATGAVKVMSLGETIANSFSVAPNGGVFVVTVKALYRLQAGTAGQPVVSWRVVYPNSGIQKPGQVSAGSGTTPTLMSGGYVAIQDNAVPREHVLVYRQATRAGSRRLVCSVPVFAPGASANENSLIVAGRSIVAENNYGYSSASAVIGSRVTSPGMTRIDLNARGTACRVAWANTTIRVPSVVSKVSLHDGLVFTYTKPKADNSVGAWYFTAVNYATGRVVYSRVTGTGPLWNNNYSAVSIAPSGRVYLGVIPGIISVFDPRQ